MNRTLIYLLAFAGLTVAAALATVYVQRVAEDEASAIAKASVSLAQAVGIAERHVGGRAVSAEYEDQQGQWVFAVEVVKGKGTMDVTVEAATGKVLAAVGNIDPAVEPDKE
jgi:uncharacterized membrane protein YkoI